MSLFAELKRRNVFRVAAAYVVLSWLVLQIVDVVAPILHLPDSFAAGVFLLLAIGFLPALAFSWVYELTPEGLKKESQIDPEQSVASHTGRKLDYVTIGMIVIGVAIVFLQPRITAPSQSSHPSDATTVAELVAAASEPASKSIAVLPFVNMSSDAENEYFSDGLTETLLHKLAQVSKLRVAARTSSFAFKGTATDIREIAEKLNVENVLEGSVQRSGDKVRITAQLIQASDGYHLWSETYDRDLDDIFAVQDEIATQVTLALRGSLLEGSAPSARSDGGTDNTEAYDVYLRAREAYRGETERSLAEAERLMRKAVVLDPEFALAWSGLAEAILEHGIYSGVNWRTVKDEMIAAAEKGVALAPDHSITVGVLGYVQSEYGEVLTGRALLEQAIKLDPNNATVLGRLADNQFDSGEYDAAVKTTSLAMTIDPLDFALKADSTYKFMNVGRIQEAELLADAILDHNPDSVLGLSSKGNIYWRTGRITQAFRTYHRLLQINPNTAHILARIARSYLELGDLESAWRWLERAAEINPEGLHAEKARYCRMTGDLACAKENYQLALAWADEEERQVNLKADIAALEKDWPTALEHLNRRIRLALDRGSSFGPTVERLTAAWVADKMGLVEQRDEYLGLAIADTRVGIENGSRAQYSWWLYANAYAIKGDAARTHENLALAIERGFRNLPYVLHTGYYDKVLNDPKIVELLEQLKADNWRELQSLQAAEAELEGGLGI